MRIGWWLEGGAGMAKSAQDRRVYTPSTSGAVRDRRPGHCSHRTVRGADRPDHPGTIGWPPPWAWPPTSGHRRRGGLFGRGPGAAALPRRAPLATGRPHQGRAPVPPTAVPAGLQPSPARGRLAAGGRPALAGRPHPGHHRAAAAAGRDPGGVRPVAGHRGAFRPCRLGRLRPRQLPPLLLLGRPAAAGLYPRGTVTGFGLANPKLLGERQAVVDMLQQVPANRPAPGTVLVGDKGFAGRDFQAALADLELGIVRPARTDEPQGGVLPNWLRQRVEAIIWTLKHQLGLDRPGGRIPAGLWARVIQRLLALNAAIWFNWQIGAPAKRSLIAYDH